MRAALNAPAMQELRRDLARGRLGRYCEHTRSCPIVQARMRKAGEAPAIALVGVADEPALSHALELSQRTPADIVPPRRQDS